MSIQGLTDTETVEDSGRALERRILDSWSQDSKTQMKKAVLLCSNLNVVLLRTWEKGVRIDLEGWSELSLCKGIRVCSIGFDTHNMPSWY